MSEKFNNWVIPVLFLILPFAIISPGLIWRSHQLVLFLSGLAIIAFSIKNLWIRIFLLYALCWQIVIFLLAFNHQQINPGFGLSVIISMLAGSIVFKFITDNKLPNEKWYMIIRIAVIIQLIIGIIQFSGFNVVVYFLSKFTMVQERTPTHMVGTLGNRNFLAAFISMSIPMFMGWRTFSFRGIKINPWVLVIFAALFVSPSPAVLAAIIGLTFFFVYCPPAKISIKGWFYIGGGVVAALVYGISYVLITGNHLGDFTVFPQQLKELAETGGIQTEAGIQDLGRFGMWLMALGKLTQTWFGAVIGFGPNAYWGRSYPLHNEYMTIWFEFGLIGLGLVFAYIYTSIKFLLKTKNKVLLTSLIILCLDMVANFPMEIASTAFMAIIIIGLIERERLIGKT